MTATTEHCHTCCETAEGKDEGDYGHDIRSFPTEFGVEPTCRECRIDAAAEAA